MINGVAWEPVDHRCLSFLGPGVLVNGSFRMWISDKCIKSHSEFQFVSFERILSAHGKHFYPPITSIFTHHAAYVAIFSVTSRRHEA
jgi:hypothetical protein